MATSQSDKTVVHALEELTGLALELLKALGQPEIKETKQRYLFYVAAIFKAVCLNADSVLRLHPLSVFHADPCKPVFNPAAMAVLARMLMEGYVNLHYFGGSDVSEERREDGREFRCIVGDIQRVRARLQAADSMDAERAAGRAPPLPPADTPEARYWNWRLERAPSALADELAFWLRALEDNSHFKGLGAKEQDAWRSGRLSGDRRYGFSLGRKQRSDNAGVPELAHKRVYGLLSAYGHTSPQALDRIYWFQAFDWVAIQDQISMPTTLCSGFVALAIREFLHTFPQYKCNLSPELWALVASCASFIMGPSPDNGSAQQTGDE